MNKRKRDKKTAGVAGQDSVLSLIEEIENGLSSAKPLWSKTLAGGVIEQPSCDAVSRFELIPLFCGSEKSVPSVHGTTAYDSWAGNSPVALRDATDGHVRRIQLKAKSLSLEIVAERRQNHWEFVARVYSGQKVKHDFVLKVGARKVLPFSGGFYHWTSRSVPYSIRLLSYKRRVIFDKLLWQ
ncbi:MAG: hypothetical protein OEW00_01705 [candidate division Zixibacteria bacterium]|nr:hypothetical protein [candidate division Zixibacteria bacterium]